MTFKLAPLAQQVIVITGASSGIGLATARLAVKRGAKVVMAARDGDAMARISGELNAQGGQTTYVVADVSDEAQVNGIAEHAIAEFGTFDTWVNNAGVGVISTVDQTSTEDHRRIFDVNYFGLVYGSLVAVRHFRERGKPGAVINMGSLTSDVTQMLSVPYAASKHAIKGFTDGLRVELLKEQLPISVTLIKPSAIDTRFFDHAKTNMGGMGKGPGPNYAPEVVAEAVLYAAAHRKRDIMVGQTAVVGGAMAALVPGSVDRQHMLPYEIMVDYDHMPEDENLYHAPREGFERSRYGHGRKFSLTTSAQTHPMLSMGAMIIAAGAAALVIGSSGRRH